MAGLLGLPFAFAHHFSAANTLPALALYRRTFRPSAVLAEPYCLISVAVLCAADAEQASWLHGSSRLSMLRLRTGRPSTLPSPEEAADYPYTDAERAVVADRPPRTSLVTRPPHGSSCATSGSAQAPTSSMITTSTYTHQDRLRSYELLAETAVTQPPSDSGTTFAMSQRPGSPAPGSTR